MVRVSLGGAAVWNDGSVDGGGGTENQPAAKKSPRIIRSRSGSRESASPAGPSTLPPTIRQPSPNPLVLSLPDEIISPLDGEVVAVTDIDGAANIYGRCKEVGDACYQTQVLIRRVLWEQTEGLTKTRRLKGKQRLLKLEAAPDSWDGRVLMELWHAYPQFRDAYLRIARVEAQAWEVKKLASTSSNDPDFLTFRDRLLAACLGSTGTPTLTVER